VTSVEKQHGHFVVTTPQQIVTAARVVLALGRRGTPRKLGVPGEERPNVMYRLIDASSFVNNRILVVGGGNSAVEAAIGLSIQRGNTVTLSYRKDSFARITSRNRKNLDERVATRTITLLLNSDVRSIEPGEVRLSAMNGFVSVPADHVFIFAGGEMPFAFLEQAGVQMQHQLVPVPD
jgi:thioredoxin reductase